MENDDKHSVFSSIREEYVEYIFLAELCSYAWRTNQFVSVARSNTDAFGYDVILTCDGQTRHVQLKATKDGGRASDQKINTRLKDAPSGCVIWLYINPDDLQPFRFGWFGGAAGERLPELGDVIARNTRANAQGEKLERPGIRKLKKSRFTWLDTIEEVFDHLFSMRKEA